MEKYLTWGLEKEIDEMSESLSAKMEGSAQKRKKNYIDETMSTGANWRSYQWLKWNNYRKNKVVLDCIAKYKIMSMNPY